MKLRQMPTRIKVEQKATELLIDLGINPVTKGFELIRLIVCDLCYEDHLSNSPRIYERYAEKLGWSVATVERLLSYGNNRAYLKRTSTYQLIFGWYGDEGATSKRNYEFLKGLKDHLRRFFFKEWDWKTQRDIIINDEMVLKGADQNSRGFYLLKSSIHQVIDAHGDLLPMRSFFKTGNLTTNLTACSRAVEATKMTPKHFIYQIAREFLLEYPHMVDQTAHPHKANFVSQA